MNISDRPCYVKYIITGKREVVLKPLYARIRIANGVNALLDYGDAEKCAKYVWRTSLTEKTIYAQTNSKLIGSNQRLMHRFVLKPPVGVMVDHWNGNGLDNRRVNLRPANSKQNSQNSFVADIVDKTSRFKGVHWSSARSAWVASIVCDGMPKQIGRFDDEEEAASAYDAAAVKEFGEFARTNQMMSLFSGQMSERRNDAFVDGWARAWPILDTPAAGDPYEIRDWCRIPTSKKSLGRAVHKRRRKDLMVRNYHATLD